MKKILYLSYTGLCEPLGRSQVLNYMKKISLDFSVTIVTFEKLEDFGTENFRQIQSECDEYGIQWIAKQYHSTPRLAATLLDVFQMVAISYKILKKNRQAIVHCRSYVTGLAGLILNRLLQVDFVFDMRALWVDEITEGNTINKKSILTKALYKLEELLLKKSYSVISLTRVAIPYLVKKYSIESDSKFVVIPTCVELEKFSKSKKATNSKTVGTMGTIVSGRVNKELIFKFFYFFNLLNANVKSKIITRDPVTSFSSCEFFNSSIEVVAASSDTIVDELLELDFGFVFFTPGVSTLGTSPTRIGEMLSLGIPIIANKNVGDVEEIINKYNVGVVVESSSDKSIAEAVQKAVLLWNDNEVSQRCKLAAKDYYSLSKGVETLKSVYSGTSIRDF